MASQPTGTRVAFNPTTSQVSVPPYNRSRGYVGPYGTGAPNFTHYFKPPGTRVNSPNISALTAQFRGATLGPNQGTKKGGRRNTRKNKKHTRKTRVKRK